MGSGSPKSWQHASSVQKPESRSRRATSGLDRSRSFGRSVTNFRPMRHSTMISSTGWAPGSTPRSSRRPLPKPKRRASRMKTSETRFVRTGNPSTPLLLGRNSANQPSFLPLRKSADSSSRDVPASIVIQLPKYHFGRYPLNVREGRGDYGHDATSLPRTASAPGSETPRSPGSSRRQQYAGLRSVA